LKLESSSEWSKWREEAAADNELSQVSSVGRVIST
jgi:hypothetical protein